MSISSPAVVRGKTTSIAEQRAFPFPCQAMLAICSDLDETPSAQRYLHIAQFLNTSADTPAGRGLGLEVGNTIYFDMPDDQFAYWNTDEAGRNMVRSLIRSGHIDCFHSFGDFATQREQAARALADLEQHGCRIECWVDHAAAATNFGADIMRGSGDLPDAPAYHADITYRHGVRFVWRGRVTSVIGQQCPRSLSGLYSAENPLASGRAIAVELAKGALARLGNEKYAMHAGNDVFRPARLRDDSRVFEFMRCNPYWGGTGAGATADYLGEVLTPAFLDQLVKRQGTCILYTHLGRTSYPDTLFKPETITALRGLADVTSKGQLLVTTTRRLLGYCLSMRYLKASVETDGTLETVSVDTSDLRNQEMPVDVSGATFYVKSSSTARVIVDGVETQELTRNPEDHYGRQSVSIPWPKLAFPQVSLPGHG